MCPSLTTYWLNGLLTYWVRHYIKASMTVLLLWTCRFLLSHWNFFHHHFRITYDLRFSNTDSLCLFVYLSVSHIVRVFRPTHFLPVLLGINGYKPFLHNRIHGCYFMIRLWMSITVEPIKISKSSKDPVICMCMNLKKFFLNHKYFVK